MTPGTTYHFTMDVYLDGMASERATPKAYTFQPPAQEKMMALAPATGVTMGTDNVLKWTRPNSYADGTTVDPSTLTRFHYYVFAKREGEANWRYVNGVDTEQAEVPGEWWTRNAAAGSAGGGIDYPVPSPGEKFTFTVASRHFTSDGQEWVSDYATPIEHTFPSVGEPPEPPKPPGIPVLLDVTAKIEGKTYTVRLEGVAVPAE